MLPQALLRAHLAVWPVPQAVPDTELSVNEFLFLLSVSWLTGQPVPADIDNFGAIGRMAGERGVQDLYQHVFRSLAEGTSIGEMVASRELGQLQLAIAAA